MNPANPDDLTLRELLWQYHGKCKQDWNHTSYITWMLYNVNRSDKSPDKNPQDFHPYHCKDRDLTKGRTSDLSAFKSICKNTKRKK